MLFKSRMIDIGSKYRRIAAATLPALLLAASLAHAQTPGDPDNGRRLAEAWCVNCHVLDSSKQAASTGAPSFAAIAADKTITAERLGGFLRAPHQRMPDMHLSNPEIDDLIAFLLAPRSK